MRRLLATSLVGLTLFVAPAHAAGGPPDPPQQAEERVPNAAKENSKVFQREPTQSTAVQEPVQQTQAGTLSPSSKGAVSTPSPSVSPTPSTQPSPDTTPQNRIVVRVVHNIARWMWAALAVIALLLASMTYYAYRQRKSNIETANVMSRIIGRLPRKTK